MLEKRFKKSFMAERHVKEIQPDKEIATQTSAQVNKYFSNRPKNLTTKLEIRIIRKGHSVYLLQVWCVIINTVGIIVVVCILPGDIIQKLKVIAQLASSAVWTTTNVQVLNALIMNAFGLLQIGVMLESQIQTLDCPSGQMYGRVEKTQVKFVISSPILPSSPWACGFLAVSTAVL